MKTTPSGAAAPVIISRTGSIPPTQTAHPERAAWRTIVETVLSGILVLGVVAPIVAGILGDELGDVLPGTWLAQTVAVSAAIAAGAAALARIMAIPAVDRLLRHIGLSARPVWADYPAAAYTTGDDVLLEDGQVVSIREIEVAPGAEMAGYSIRYADGTHGTVHESQIVRRAGLVEGGTR